MAWAIPFCSGDVCMNHSSHYVGEVDRRILEAGEIDLASPSTINRNAENEVAFAVQLAQMGKTEEGYRKLQSVSENSNKIFYGRASKQEMQSQVERSRAQILSLQGKSDESKDAFKQAFYSAKAIHTFEKRAKRLITLAQAMVTSGYCDMAIPVIKDARITNDYTMMFDRRRVDSERELTAQIAYLFAKCGALNEAISTALPLLSKQGEPAGRAYEAKLLADQIRIKVATYHWENNEKGKALEELQGIPPSLAKLEALLHIEALESKKNASDHAVIKKYLLKQAEEYESYFWTLTSDAERRFMLSAFAKIIRIRNDKSESLFTFLVSESARIETQSWRARALCELGYTAGILGQSDSAGLFEQGISLAKQHRKSFFPFDPSPAGACAYWLKQSGNTEKAKLVADYPIESLRAQAIKNQGQGQQAYASDLLSLAISYGEAESGEIALDWRRQFHFE